MSPPGSFEGRPDASESALSAGRPLRQSEDLQRILSLNLGCAGRMVLEKGDYCARSKQTPRPTATHDTRNT